MVVLLSLLVFLLSNSIVASGPVKVEIIKDNDTYQLYRGGKPYHIKGAGLEFGDINSLVAHGGNSIRTWSTVNKLETAQELLDRAHALGVTVSLCLALVPERLGFDYKDKEQLAAQLEKFRAVVLKYRNHPALLTWIIGNELNHSYTVPEAYDAVNNISKMIHELDPNHPTTTTTSGIKVDVTQEIINRAPDLDFISFQAYGELDILSDFIKETKYTKPFMVTEWGAVGFWEMKETAWGAPFEMNSSDKAANYLKGYQQQLLPLKNQIIGNYVFLWGQKQERTPTWFGLFTDSGDETEAVDVMHYIWNGSWPDNRTPAFKSITLNNKTSREDITLTAGKSYSAKVDVEDYEDDTLSYFWEIKLESNATQEGGDFETNIESLSKLIKNAAMSDITITTPSHTGAYRLFVYIGDGNNNKAHGNIPFYVNE
jgi:hypothetical protein